MKNGEKSMKLNKYLLILFMWVCWFFLDTRPEIYQIVPAVSFLGYIFIKNNIFSIVNLCASFIATAVMLDWNVALLVYSPMLVLFVYKISIVSNKKNSFKNISNVILTFVPILSVLAMVFNLQEFKMKRAVVFGVVMAISFLLFSRSAQKMDNTEKDKKIQYWFVFCVSAFGVIMSAIAYCYGASSGVTFFPWFLFINVLVLEEDKCVGKSCVLLGDILQEF